MFRADIGIELAGSVLGESMTTPRASYACKMCGRDEFIVLANIKTISTGEAVAIEETPILQCATCGRRVSLMESGKTGRQEIAEIADQPVQAKTRMADRGRLVSNASVEDGSGLRRRPGDPQF